MFAYVQERMFLLNLLHHCLTPNQARLLEFDHVPMVKRHVLDDKTAKRTTILEAFTRLGQGYPNTQAILLNIIFQESKLSNMPKSNLTSSAPLAPIPFVNIKGLSYLHRN